MLVIRDAQIQAIIAQDDEQIEGLVEASVRKADPVRVQSIAPARLRSMVRLCILRAREEGVAETENIAAYAALMFVISPMFDSQPAIAAVLNDGSFAKSELIAQLFERVPNDAWEDAVAMYDEQFWFDENARNPAPENTGEERPGSPNYLELTLEQADKLERLAADLRDSRTEADVLRLEIEIEKLSFLQTAAKGMPKVRAEQAYEKARDSVLARAITRPLPNPGR